MLSCEVCFKRAADEGGICAVCHGAADDTRARQERGTFLLAKVMGLAPGLGLCIALSTGDPPEVWGHLFLDDKPRTHPAVDLQAYSADGGPYLYCRAVSPDGQAFLDLLLEST